MACRGWFGGVSVPCWCASEVGNIGGRQGKATMVGLWSDLEDEMTDRFETWETRS